ncbi:NAD-P-binding protein [Panus rudis PR-1116 ss-1]|nr:NAD-P-binding protein [Panus rudis PR-1116 ss-1]
MSTRVAIVTGAAQGIGEAIAVRLAEENIDLALFDLKEKEEQLKKVVKQVEAKGRKAIYVVGDITVENDVKGLVDKTVEVLGGLDIMVANAGITMFKPFIETTVEDYNRLMSINVLGVIHSFKYAAIQMIKQGRGGRIIGASSGAGKKGIHNMSVYSASKFAVRGLTQATALELRPHGITVNSYAPGFILTPMLAHPDDDKFGGHGSVAKMAAKMPPELEGAHPKVIGELISYFIKPEAHFVTGQTISIDGGLNFD